MNRNIQIAKLIFLLVLIAVVLSTPQFGCAKDTAQEEEMANEESLFDSDEYTIAPTTEYDNPLWDLAFQIAMNIPDSLERSIAIELIAENMASENRIRKAFEISLEIPDSYYQTNSLATLARHVIIKEIIPQYLYNRADEVIVTDTENNDQQAIDYIVSRFHEITQDISEPIESELADSIRDVLATTSDEALKISDPIMKASVLMSIADSYRMLGNLDEYNTMSHRAWEMFESGKEYLHTQSGISSLANEIFAGIDITINQVVALIDLGDFNKALLLVKEYDDMVSTVAAISYLSMYYETQDFKPDSAASDTLNRIASKYGIIYKPSSDNND